MDNILFWNARGAGNDKFKYTVKDLVKMHSLDILIICEPKVQFKNSKKYLLHLGFTDYEVMEARGFSGGIWLLWNNSKVKVDYVDSNAQSISVKVTGDNGHSWLLSGVYGSTCNTVRTTLWDYFDTLTMQVNLPWMLVGDFNKLLSYSDKSGGSHIYRFGGMKNWVSRNGMIDMGYQGADFTWSNRFVKERLDRGFCCCDWRVLFPDACVIHLARLQSDHCPILIRLRPDKRFTRINTPFRFQAMWMEHENYKEFVDSSWNGYIGNVIDKTKTLATDLSQWNKEVFGNIFQHLSI